MDIHSFLFRFIGICYINHFIRLKLFPFIFRQEPNTMKKPSLKKSSKEHPSREQLVQTGQTPSRWKRFKPKCPRCFKKNEKTVQISTITKGSDVQKLPKKSCFKRYLCCFCYKCKLKRGKTMEVSEQPKVNKKCLPMRCCSCCRNPFSGIFKKLSCKKKKKNVDLPESMKSDTGVACISVPKKRGCGGNCKSGLSKCLGILCCLNTAFCLKLNNCCKKICCSKCLCFGGKKKQITEPERRKSTISAPKKRRWTRMFTVSIGKCWYIPISIYEIRVPCYVCVKKSMPDLNKM